MHLAIVSPYPPNLTGVGQYGYHVSRALARTGMLNRITLLTEQSSPPGWAKTQGEEAEPYSPVVDVKRIWSAGHLDTGWKIARELHKISPDLVWYNLGTSSFGRWPLANLSGRASPIASQLFGLPSVVTLHEMVEQTGLKGLNVPYGPLAALGIHLTTRAYTCADVVCVTLKRHAKWLRSRYPDLRLAHIPHGCFQKPQRLPVAEQKELLIFSSFAPFKGLELLLAAFGDLQQRYPALRLTIAGVEHPRFPGYLKRVRQLAESRNLTGVEWLGPVPEEKLEDVFRRASIVVLPYLATTGSSSVLFRAASWGRPVVISDLTELKSAVEEADLSVEFFRSGDRFSLSESIERLINHLEVGNAMVSHNLRAAAQMTLEETAQAYLRAFNLALAAHPKRARLPLPIRPGQEAL